VSKLDLEATPVQSRLTAHEMVRNNLRLAILGGRLTGGTRLVQADIAEQLNVSTTPVREALRDLAAEGLIRIDNHRGAVVEKLDVDEIEEVYEIRKALEPLAVRLAAQRMTAEEIEQASAILDEMETITDAARWVEMNWEFHTLIERSARSPRLQGVVKIVQGTSSLYVAHSLQVDPNRMTDGNVEHRAILSALARRDGDIAGEIHRKHLDRTLQGIITAYRDPAQPTL
jgi:DNA-binding GntR family transcriptional regulator